MNTQLEKRYAKLIKTLNIPEERQEVNEQNLRWFLRNGAISNMKNINCLEAISLARQILQ